MSELKLYIYFLNFINQSPILHCINICCTIDVLFEFQIHHLASFGGSCAREVVDRIMVGLFENDLAVRYNWKGRGDKSGLEKFLLTKAIKGMLLMILYLISLVLLIIPH